MGTYHRFLDFDNGMSCIVCGGFWNRDRENDIEPCTGRTDLVHGYDTSSHSLDNCADYDENGTCSHLAIELGCDCSLCQP